MRLLIVDDDDMAARAVEWALNDAGVDTRSLTSAGDVLRVIAEMRPDAVVLDVILDEIDGVEVCRRVRQTWPSLPVVLASGRDADFPGVREALTAGPTAFLQKPFDIATLVETISKLAGQ